MASEEFLGFKPHFLPRHLVDSKSDFIFWGLLEISLEILGQILKNRCYEDVFSTKLLENIVNCLAKIIGNPSLLIKQAL